jgi:hypothetical protein
VMERLSINIVRLNALLNALKKLVFKMGLYKVRQNIIERTVNLQQCVELGTHALFLDNRHQYATLTM